MSICCKRFHNTEFFIWCFRNLKVLELWATSYMQIVLRWLIKLNFSWILSAFNFLMNICLPLVLLNLSILIWYILSANYFIYLLLILFIIKLRVLSFWSIIIHCCTFRIFGINIIVWMVHIAALRLIDCFIRGLIRKLSLWGISNTLNSIFTSRSLILVSLSLLCSYAIIHCVYIFLYILCISC